MSNYLLLTCALLTAASLAAMPALLSAQADSGGAAVENSAADEFEEIESVEEIEVVEEAGAARQAGLFQTIGRFHPVVLHFPIAWLVLLVLVEMVLLTGFAGELNRWASVLLVLTLLSFIPAIVSGLGMASSHTSAAAEFTEKMIMHRNINIASGLVLLVAGVVRLAIGQAAGFKARAGYCVLILAAAGLLIFGSHLGGEMVWGEGFLPTPF